MVQDTSISPELYLVNTEGNDILKQCNVFWVVSIPGQSLWSTTGTESADHLSGHPSPQSHKYPIPHRPHIGVQVKIYHENQGKNIRVTDLMSFIGILSSESLTTNLDISSPINVPTLHVLSSKSIPITILSRVFPDPSLLPSIETLREGLITWIANEALAGDRIAAEWILLCTIARVHSRVPPMYPLSLTISNFPSVSNEQTSTPALFHVLSQLLPMVSVLPLSLNMLNDTSFYPESKDEDLHSGWLQHPKGSTIICTEGGVTEGIVVQKGVMNIRSAQEVMKGQTLEYVFPFSNYKFETDICFIITTEGKQNTFFETNVTVPLQPSTSADIKQSLHKDAGDIRPTDEIQKYRQLLGGSKIGEVTIGPDLAKHIEDDFVRERATFKNDTIKADKAFTTEDLIQRIFVTRLVALSLHQMEVTTENWEHAKALESQLKHRLDISLVAI
ncbi:hypothetical protein BYT27DRAFT_7195476 [Phlegmacium glaucopus]|nr:hypothetical protein BYT27DRAFT_7195476 [Phlegmacium glaucopus]